MQTLLRRGRRLVLAAAVLTLTSFAFAGSAHAFANSYCGVLIYEGTWCGDGSNHSYNFNRAQYTGGGSVWVCERLLIADTSSEVAGPSCAYNYAARSYGAYPWLTEAEVTHYYSGGARHTIYGYATA